MSSQDGYARARELHEKDIHSVYLTELVASGFLVRLKRGLYTIAEGTGRSELVEVQKAIPSGIFCLGTALSMHHLGTWEPPEIHLAIRRDYRVVIPHHPPIRLFSFSGLRYELGIIEQDTDAGIVKVYDLEKTICDIVRFRNAIGHDVAVEALRGYLKKPDRNIQKLLEYAKVLRMEGSLRQYLEVLL